MLRSVQRNYWISRQLMAKLHLITYGCQMNEYDSERVAGLLRAERYELTADEQEADLILVNTCAIREKAEEKVFSKLGELRKLKTKNPELIIGVMGCMAQLQQEAIQRRVPAVDLVFGSPAIARVGELVERVRRERRPVLETGEGPLVKITVRPPSASRLKAFVTVMEGCEIAPVGVDRLAEERHLAAGCREVTLLGQTVNAYGRDLTAFHHGDECLQAGGRRWADRNLHERALAGLEHGPPLTSHPFHQFPDARDRRRAEHEVDGRDAPLNRLLLELRHASHDADDQLGVFRLELPELAELREDLLLRLLADRAGVDEDQVGLLLVCSELIALGAEQARDALRVVLVHLTAIRDEVELCH